jgi:hypothetical protein
MSTDNLDAYVNLHGGRRGEKSHEQEVRTHSPLRQTFDPPATLPKEMQAVDMPPRLRNLPRDARGYPVPWFVDWPNGVPDFRVVDARKYPRAVRERRCWICGDIMGRYMAFVIGPMCAINRISSEPPSHRECAEYAAQVCPFLARPEARRNPMNLPTEAYDAAGIGISRNPGVTLVWITHSYERLVVPRKFEGQANSGVLFQVGPATAVKWYAHGRIATPAEVWASIDSGLDLLRTQAEVEGPEAVKAFNAVYARACSTVLPVRPVSEAQP